MRINDLKDKINRLGKAYKVERIEDFFENSIRINIDSNQKGNKFSKFGGQPHIPENLSWPYEYREIVKSRFFSNNIAENVKLSLSFLAQLSFTEIWKETGNINLPREGFLYFFYCQDQDSWGIYKSDLNKFKILYSDCSLKECIPAPVPDDLLKNGVYDEVYVSFESSMSLKSIEEEGEMPDYVSDEFFDELCDLVDTNDYKNQLLGASYNIQGEMKSHALQMINQTSEGEQFEQEDIILLFQLDSVDECKMNWGDGGILYFWTTKKSVENKDFKNSWLILQCY